MMSVLQNPSQVIATRKVLTLKNWTEAQQRVEELNLGSWDSIKTAWDRDPLYANIELRTPVLLIGEDWIVFINGLFDEN